MFEQCKDDGIYALPAPSAPIRIQDPAQSRIGELESKALSLAIFVALLARGWLVALLDMTILNWSGV